MIICARCIYYQSVNDEEGRCRKHPPQTLPMPQKQSRVIGQSDFSLGVTVISYWPQVKGNVDFCGEFQVRKA